MTIHKYVINPDNMIHPGQFVELDVPNGAKFISATEQHGKIVVYAYVEPRNSPTRRRVWPIETGALVSDALEYNIANKDVKYLGVVQLHGGEIMIHIYTD